MIAAITGNVGISGGGTAPVRAWAAFRSLPPRPSRASPEKNTVDVCVSFFDWYQAIEDYTVMTTPPGASRAIDETGVTSYAEEPGTLKLKAPISSSGTTAPTS